MATTIAKRKLKTTGRKRAALGWDKSKIRSRGRRKRGMRGGWDPTKIAG